MNARLLRTLAWLLLLGALVAWAAAGANRGWTQTTVPVKQLDEVTGIEGISYRSKFVPGLDFLALAGAVTAGLMLVSFFWQRRASPAPGRDRKPITPNL